MPESDRKGTLIVHGWSRVQRAGTLRLRSRLIELPFGALLVGGCWRDPLLAAGLLAALVAAVAVSAIAVRADEENRMAALTQANPLSQNRFAMNHRHASSQAGLDNGTGLVAGLKPALFGFTCRMVAEHGNPAALTAGFPLFLALRQDTSLQRSLWMIGRMIAPAAR